MGSCKTGTSQVYISKRILSPFNQNDKRWARIGNGLKVAGEITEFNSRITDAKELFKVNSQVVFVGYNLTHPATSIQDLSIINLSGGIDAIYGAIKLLLKRQDSISREITRIREMQLRQLVSL